MVFQPKRLSSCGFFRSFFFFNTLIRLIKTRRVVKHERILIVDEIILLMTVPSGFWTPHQDQHSDRSRLLNPYGELVNLNKGVNVLPFPYLFPTIRYRFQGGF